MAKIEKFAYPLMVVAGVATVILAFGRKNQGATQVNAVGTGYDTYPDQPRQNFLGGTIAPIQQQGIGTDPGYIQAASIDPYSQDPSQSAAEIGSAPAYLTQNANYPPGTFPRIVASPDGSLSFAGQDTGAGGCGCGGGCGGCAKKSTCQTDCASNARIVDSRGTCLIDTGSLAAMQPVAYQESWIDPTIGYSILQ